MFDDLADLDRRTFEQVRALGQDLLVSIVDDFRRGAPDDIADLERGLADADAVLASRSAHRLKGICLILGATRLGALAGEVERAASEGDLDRAGQLLPALERSFGDLVAALEAAV